MVDTGYSATATGSGGAGAVIEDGNSIDALRRAYADYLDSKSEEIKEQQESRRYYHGSQYTEEQVKALQKRKQPVVTYNRVGRKINAVIGLLEKMRQDPRAYPRTPQHEEGAEIATATVRYVLDSKHWEAISQSAGLTGAVDGIGGCELLLEQGDNSDLEVALAPLDTEGFFYDPRSRKPDFSDARYMGVGKWMDVDEAVEMFPDQEQAIRDGIEHATDLTSNPDSEKRWVADSRGQKRVRVVDHWYRKGGQWRYCVHTGTHKLAEGISPFRDEFGKTICKYIAYSANVDHDGDRYGFVRNMRSSQDEINARRSKGLFQLNTRRLTVKGMTGGGINLERERQEAARPDGVIGATVTDPNIEISFDDAAKSAELQGQLAFLADAKSEIENYGFNPALIGTGVQDMSGRAIQLQQQAGIAELGPFLQSFRGWKIRVYRAIWNAVRDHWKAERWIRVTDDENVAQFMAVNQLGIDPRTGMPTLVNALGALDVDIIIDEGPDTINSQADAYDTLSVMAKQGGSVPPEILIELSPLQGSLKKRILDRLEQAQKQAGQPGPVQMQGIQLDLEAKQVDNEKTRAETAKIMAETQKTGIEAGMAVVETQRRTMEPIGVQGGF